jgi:hypothetical protein
MECPMEGLANGFTTACSTRPHYTLTGGTGTCGGEEWEADSVSESNSQGCAVFEWGHGGPGSG